MEKNLKYIQDSGLKIKAKKKTIEFVNDYGLFRTVDCYGAVLKRLVSKPNTKQLMMLFDFDTSLSALVSKYILDFEKILNNVAVQTTLQVEELDENYILDIVKNPAHSSLRNKGYATFVQDVYENVDSCTLLENYRGQKDIPLRILSTS